MKIDLTDKQSAVLQALEAYVRERGHAPTYSELAELTGYDSISSLQKHIDALKKKGVITSSGLTSRSLKLNNSKIVDVPLIGAVACGMPTLAEEHIEAYIPLDASMLKGDGSSYFFLRANGDSMDKAGINDGDYLLVKRQQHSSVGSKVIALIGEEATCKLLKKSPDGLYILMPQSTNPTHKPRMLFENSSILGVVEKVVSPRKEGQGGPMKFQ